MGCIVTSVRDRSHLATTSSRIGTAPIPIQIKPEVRAFAQRMPAPRAFSVIKHDSMIAFKAQLIKQELVTFWLMSHDIQGPPFVRSVFELRS